MLSHQRAVFSPDRRYRYVLRRPINAMLENGTCLFIGLNPSTADEEHDDPTIRRCKGFARAWGYSLLVVCNLFAYRATDPTDMKAQDDPVGPDNDRVLIAEATSAHLVVLAWGNDGAFLGRSSRVLDILGSLTTFHLGLTKAGEPKHPLYLASITQPVLYGEARRPPR